MQFKEFSAIQNYKVDVFKENGVFKYAIGNETNLESVKNIQKIAKENGYKDAFIIAFLNNKKIGISEAINQQRNNNESRIKNRNSRTYISIMLLIWGINFLKGNNIFGNSNEYYSIYKNIEV